MRRISTNRRRVTVGLDVGSGLVKAAAIDHSGRGPRLLSLALAPLHREAIVDGDVLNGDAVRAAIQRVVAETDQPDATLAVAIGGRDVFVERVSVREAVPRQGAAYEARIRESHRPDSVRLDCQMLAGLGDAGGIDVVRVAALRDLVAQRLSVVREAGYEPGIVDAEASALLAVLEACRPAAPGGDELLVSVGHRSTLVLWVRARRLVALRHLAAGTARLWDALTADGGLTPDEADACLAASDGAEPSAGGLLAAASDALARSIASAVADAVADETEAGSRPPPTLLLAGGGAAVEQVRRAVERRLGLPSEVLDPLCCLDGTGALDLPRGFEPAMTLPIGLALRV